MNDKPLDDAFIEKELDEEDRGTESRRPEIGSGMVKKAIQRVICPA